MIEFGAKLSLKDNMSATLQKNLKLQKDFSKQVEQVNAGVKTLGKATASPTLKANDEATEVLNKVRDGIESADEWTGKATVELDAKAAGVTLSNFTKKVNQFSHERILTKAEVDDQATKKIDEITEKIKKCAKTVASPVIRIKDSASTALGNITQKLKAIATSYTPIVKVRDMATQGISKIKNTLGGITNKAFTTAVNLKDGATSKINDVRITLKALGKMVATPIMKIKDTASKPIGKVQSALKTVGKTVTSPLVAIKDKASAAIDKVKSGLSSVGSMTATAAIAIKDGASAGLSKIKDLLGTLAKGVTIAVGLAGAGATLLLKGSISEGASLEQSIGGVETLFGDDASTVIANAYKAFETAGVSANDYMEQVTSFSASLLNSLSGDTTRATSIADQAIIDMSDNANKFGTDIESIQNAYQGFAKQNYTMLDNLKLGYGGTESEMERLLKDAAALSGTSYDIDNLADVYEAIHVIQESLGVTGTTAEEASETFSGSLAAMKAAASNLFGNMAIGEDITESVEQLISTASTFVFSNFIPMLGNVFSALPTALSSAVTQALPQIKELGGSLISNMRSGMLAILPSEMSDVAGTAFDTIVNGFSTGISTLKRVGENLVPVITNAVNTIAPVVGEIGDMFARVAPVVTDTLGGMFGDGSGLINGFAKIVSGVIPVVENLIVGMSDAIAVTGSVLGTLGNAFVDVLPDISAAVSGAIPVVTSMISTMGEVYKAVIPVAGSIISVFSQTVSQMMPIVSQVFSSVSAVVVPIVQGIASLIQTALPIVQNVISMFTSAISTIMPVISTIFEGVGEKIRTVVGVVQSHMGILQGVFETVSPIVQGAVEIISSVLSTAWSVISPIMDLAINVFDLLLSCVEAVFPTIQSTIQTVWNVLEPIFGSIANGLSMVGDAIGGVADFIGSGVDTVKGWFGFAYGKDRVPYDDYPAVLHEGEKVLTRNQADQYDRATSTRGVKLTVSDPVITNQNVGSTNAPTSGTTDKKETSGGNVTIEKLDININDPVITKEADVDKVVEEMVSKFTKLVPNMT